MEGNQIYACMDPGLDFGVGSNVVGCAVNCAPCETHPQHLMYQVGLNNNAPRRWVRPSTARESRAADGLNHGLRAGTPIRLPRTPVYVEIAPCFTQTSGGGVPLSVTEEHFNMELCDCPFAPFVLPDGAHSPCPALSPDEIVYRDGPIPSCWWFYGNKWPPASLVDTMGCPSFRYGHTPMLVALISGGLAGEFRNLRLDNGPYNEYPRLRYMGGCATSVGVLCWGHTEQSRCNAEEEFDPGYYNEDRSAWDYCYVDATNASFVAPSGSDAEWTAIQAAKTAALQHIATKTLPADGEGVTSFYQLDSRRRYATDAQNFNPQITDWTRSWNMFGNAATLLFDQLPVICEFPGSYLKCSGHSVVVEYVLASVLWEMSFIPYRQKDWPLTVGSPSSQQVFAAYPMIQHRIELNMGLRVRFPDSDPRYITRSWLKTPDQVPLTLNYGYNVWWI
jgi:hypothetical protein